MIQWKCHECGAAMEAPEPDAGQSRRCAKCGATSQVPPGPLPAEALNAARPLSGAVWAMPATYSAGGVLLMLLGVLTALTGVGGCVPGALIFVSGPVVLGLGGIARRLEGSESRQAKR